MARWYSSRQIGKIVGVDASTANRWIDAGFMGSFRTPGGHRRVSGDQLLEFLNGRGIPIPDDLRPAHRTVLLATSDADLARSLRRAQELAQPATKIVCSGWGVDALIRVGLAKPDVVVLDLELKDVDVPTICERLKRSAETQGIVVVALMARPSRKLERRLKEAGADVVLTKPIRTAALLEQTVVPPREIPRQAS